MLTKLSLSADFTSFLTRYSISAEVKEEEGAEGLSSPVYLAHTGKFTALYTREQLVAS